MNNKKFCPTHYFHYASDKCPFCEKERLERIAKRYEKTLDNIDPSKDEKSDRVKHPSKNDNRPATQDDLAALMAHFNK